MFPSRPYLKPRGEWVRSPDSYHRSSHDQQGKEERQSTDKVTTVFTPIGVPSLPLVVLLVWEETVPHTRPNTIHYPRNDHEKPFQNGTTVVRPWTLVSGKRLWKERRNLSVPSYSPNLDTIEKTLGFSSNNGTVASTSDPPLLVGIGTTLVTRLDRTLTDGEGRSNYPERKPNSVCSPTNHISSYLFPGYTNLSSLSIPLFFYSTHPLSSGLVHPKILYHFQKS